VKLVVVAVGGGQPRWVEDGFAEYARRMPPTLRMELREVRAEPRTTGKSVEQLAAAEAERIRAVLPKQAIRVALDERGLDATTAQLVELFARWQSDGRDVAFMIGGPDGLDAGLKREADQTLRLSSLTLPHGLARIVLAECLYRVVSIHHRHPYHRD